MVQSEKAKQRAAERKKLREQTKAHQARLLRQVQEGERARLAEEAARKIVREHEEESPNEEAERAAIDPDHWYWRKI